MKKILNMKQVENRSKETKRRKALDVLCSWTALLLSRTDSRWTQNTGTSPPDITLNNKLWSDGDRNTPKISTAQLQKLTSYEGKPFKRSFAKDTRY